MGDPKIDLRCKSVNVCVICWPCNAVATVQTFQIQFFGTWLQNTKWCTVCLKKNVKNILGNILYAIADTFFLN